MATSVSVVLSGESEQLFMIIPLTGSSAPRAQDRPVRVRALRGSESNDFAEVLGAGLGAPPVIISSAYTPAVLDAQEASAYLAEIDGVAVAAGLGVVAEGHVGLINIATLPRYRRRGHAQLVIERILSDGRAVGAHTAHLHASNETVSLFESVGFRITEKWTSLTAV